MSIVKYKCYLLINGKVIRIGLNMNRKFPEKAGSRTEWISVYHTDGEIIKVTINWAYFDMNGTFDFTYYGREAAQKIDEAIFGKERKTGKLVQLSFKVKVPQLKDEDKELIKARLIKDFGVNQLDIINFFLNYKYL